MKTKVYEKLKATYDEHGSRKFGKHCQKILALAFKEAGYTVEIEKEINAERENERYVIKVRTTTADFINYNQKSVEKFRHKKEDGYLPMLAVLQLDRFGDWFFAKADTLRAGSLYIDSLRAYRLRELEKEISPIFDDLIINQKRR